MPDTTKTFEDLSIRHDLGEERVDNDILILDKRNEKLHQLNASAAVIWQGLREGLDVEAIARKIVEVFDTAPETARVDVNRTLKNFSDLNLLEERNA